MEFGFLNIYKPVGMTSHDVVSILRRITKIKQIGHTGTLDPFAEGVLPVSIGKATRLIEFLDDDKEYLATVQFGAATTTYDREGEITFTSDKKILEDDIRSALKIFEGEISQIPPIYSAIKVKGKKLYEYARKGQEVEIQPRKVKIEHIELKSFDEEMQRADILIKCSKGTYIRSIANDLGENIGSGAHLIRLIRTRAGSFTLEETVNLDCINILKNIINPLDKLRLPVVKIDTADLKKIQHGQSIKNENLKHGDLVILIYNDNDICAVGVSDGNMIKMKKVFL